MKIRNILIFGLTLAAGMSLTSCGEDYLDRKPEGNLSEETVQDIIANEPDKISALVTGTIMNFSDGGELASSHDDTGFWAIRLASDLNCEDIAFTRNIQWFAYDYQRDNRLYNYRRVAGCWNQLYQVVTNCNELITLMLPSDGSEVTDPFSRKVLGQAYAMRAYCYYWLINLFQQPYEEGRDQLGVPIKTEKEYLEGRNTVGEVYDLIVSDCKTALSYFEGMGLPANKSEMNEYAVAGLYANVLMYMGDYNNAKEMALKAANGAPLNGQQLMSGMNSLDLDEVLWGYGVTEETTNYYASFFSHIDTYMIGYGGRVGYRKEAASVLVDNVPDTDIRSGWFGYNPEFDLLGVDYSYEKNLGFMKYLCNKFRDKYMTSMGADGPFTSDYIYMRSAEFWFVAAEAAYLAGNQGEALQYLNTVMITRDSTYKFEKTGEELYKEICFQKRVETWGEGCRYHDARRRNEFIKRSESVNTPINSLNVISPECVDYSARDARMIYQIPAKEIENNPSITNSEQNP